MTYKQSQFIQDIHDIAFDGTDSALKPFKMILCKGFVVFFIGNKNIQGGIHIQGTSAVVIKSTFAYHEGLSYYTPKPLYESRIRHLRSGKKTKAIWRLLRLNMIHEYHANNPWMSR